MSHPFLLHIHSFLLVSAKFRVVTIFVWLVSRPLSRPLSVSRREAEGMSNHKNMRQRHIMHTLFYKHATSPRLICFFKTKPTHFLLT